MNFRLDSRWSLSPLDSRLPAGRQAFAGMTIAGTGMILIWTAVTGIQYFPPPMKSIRLRSPAKLNLALKVLGKRPDGFHNLETIFERINLFDDITLKINLKSDIRIFCNDPHVPLGKSNLVHKAAQLLRDDFGVKMGVDIHIKKRIPVAAGLAGGSSNAATVLLGLNQLWRLKLSRKKLVSYAKQLGSDVAFFLSECSWALGTGRGDVIKPLKIKTKLWHVLITPKRKILTKDVFGRLNLKLTNQNMNVTILLPYLRKNNVKALGQALFNDLESAIVAIDPRLSSLKNRLFRLRPSGVCFSGSGPSIFVLAPSFSCAQQLKALLRKRYDRVFVVQTV